MLKVWQAFLRLFWIANVGLDSGCSREGLNEGSIGVWCAGVGFCSAQLSLVTSLSAHYKLLVHQSSPDCTPFLDFAALPYILLIVTASDPARLSPPTQPFSPVCFSSALKPDPGLNPVLQPANPRPSSDPSSNYNRPWLVSSLKQLGVK